MATGKRTKAEERQAAVKAERFKIMASGTQLIAVGVLGAGIIAPIFNATQQFSILLAAAGGATAGLVELVAWVLMGYAVAPVEDGTEETNA